MVLVYTLAFFIAISTALPVDETIFAKLDSGPRYQYLADDDGVTHLVDMWVTPDTLREIARFNPDNDIQYHLYTRQNPSDSQPLVFNYPPSVSSSNFNANRRTAVVIHGWMNDATSEVNNNLVPGNRDFGNEFHNLAVRTIKEEANRSVRVRGTSTVKRWWFTGGTSVSSKEETMVNTLFNTFLEAADLNVIVVDWNAGAGTINYAAAVGNTVAAGASVARFLTWLNSVTGANPSQYHIVGHSLGGQMSGIVSRNMGRSIGYITSLDPAWPGWITHSETFKPDDGIYTEVIHTDSGSLGYQLPIGQVDFYPNGGKNMPGCGNSSCGHSRAYYYFAESLRTGGFTGRRCATHINAVNGRCDANGSIKMGGITPKNGSSGSYYLETNPAPLFSKG